MVSGKIGPNRSQLPLGYPFLATSVSHRHQQPEHFYVVFRGQLFGPTES